MRAAVNKMLVALVVIITAAFIYTDGYKLTNLHGDALGYYMYLPAALIYHNLTDDTNIPLNMVDEHDPIRQSLEAKKKGLRTEKGISINQYTYGVAFMEAPFFLAAHAYEHLMGHKANGYSPPYQIALKISALAYALLGLILVYLILTRYFSPAIATITALVVFAGSNLFWFTAYQAGMSHVPLFFLYALLVYLTIRLHESPRTYLFVLCGLVAGLITIIRPTDIICLLIPLLYNVYSAKTARTKIAFLKKHLPKIGLMALVFVLPLLPQMLYWKAVAGHYLYYSYGDQHFNWAKPRLFDGLLGPSNGWLVYSPAMGLGLLGLFFYQRNKRWTLCLLTLLPLYIYIIYSWYCYNYINGLGSRPMIHMYPLLAIPMAAFFEWLGRRPLVIRGIAMAGVLLLTAMNLSYSYQQIRGLLISEESNYVFNWGMMFRLKLRYSDLSARDVGQFQPDPKKLQRTATLGVINFEDTASDHIVPDPTGHSRQVYRFDTEELSDHKILVHYHDSLFRDARWIKGSGRFMHPEAAGYYKHLLVMCIRHGDDVLEWAGCKIENKIGIADSSCHHDKPLTLDHQDENKWGDVYFFLKIPRKIQPGDIVELYIWNIGKQPLYADDLRLEAFK